MNHFNLNLSNDETDSLYNMILIVMHPDTDSEYDDVDVNGYTARMLLEEFPNISNSKVKHLTHCIHAYIESYLRAGRETLYLSVTSINNTAVTIDAIYVLNEYVKACDKELNDGVSLEKVMMGMTERYIKIGDNTLSSEDIGGNVVVQYLESNKSILVSYRLCADEGVRFAVMTNFTKGKHFIVSEVAEAIIKRSGRIKAMLSLKESSSVDDFDTINYIVESLSTTVDTTVELQVIDGVNVILGEVCVYMARGDSYIRALAKAHMNMEKLYKSTEETYMSIEFENSWVYGESISNCIKAMANGVTISEEEIANKERKLSEQIGKSKGRVREEQGGNEKWH